MSDVRLSSSTLRPRSVMYGACTSADGCVFVRRLIEILRRRTLEPRHFLVGQQRAARHVLRPFERCDGLVVPDAHQVGIAPRRARRRELLCRRRLGCGAGRLAVLREDGHR